MFVVKCSQFTLRNVLCNYCVCVYMCVCARVYLRSGDKQTNLNRIEIKH